MRIGIVCPYSLDLPGGVQGQVVGSAASFVAAGHEVMILAPGTRRRDELARPGESLELLGRTIGIKANGSVAPLSLSPHAVNQLRQRLDEFVPDVVMVHEPLVPLVSLGALFAGSAPRVGIFHRAGATRGFRFLRPLGTVVARRLADGVVVSEEARTSARSVLGPIASGYQLIGNAVDAVRFSMATPTPKKCPTAVFLGRHESRKGLEVLLAAYGQVREELALWIIGTGPETARLAGLYQDPRIEWLGRLSDEEVAERLSAADLFIAPSLKGESFGVVLLEAMAAGAAVVCSDLPGYRLAAGEAAQFVPPGDPDALAAVLNTLLADAPARAALIRQGSLRVGRFSFSSQIDRYLEIFERLLAEPRDPLDS